MTALHSTNLTGSLIEWFRSRERDVPWRAETDPYRIWLAEVMAQPVTPCALEFMDEAAIELVRDTAGMALPERVKA